MDDSSEGTESLEGASVLVTGGAGFIGSHLVDRIISSSPQRVTVVDNFFLGNERNLHEALSNHADLAIRRLDASDLAAMSDVVRERGVDVVFDLAVVPLPTSLDYPAWTVSTNIGIATTFCELARRGEIKTLIHCSSSEAYGTARTVKMSEEHPHDAITPYAASKSGCDAIVSSYVRTFGIDACIVRPFNNVGPRQNEGSYAGIIPLFVRRVMSGLPLEIHGTGEQTRDFIFVKETAEMIVRAYERRATRGHALNVATGRETSILELTQRILRLMGRSDHPITFAPRRPGDVDRHCADISLASRLLGYVPEALNDAQLGATIDFYASGASK